MAVLFPLGGGVNHSETGARRRRWSQPWCYTFSV